MKLLCLDQSTKLTGWSLYQKGSYRKSGLLDFSNSGLEPAERFTKMCGAVVDLIHKIKPEMVVLEGVTYQRNAATLIELAQLQGVIIGTCLANQIEFYIYPPSSWRKELGFSQGTGVKRSDLKRQAMNYIKEMLGHEETEDVSEAICIGAAFIHLIKKENSNGEEKGE